MTKLEQIALAHLATKIRSALEKCDIKNADKMNFQRIFIEYDLKEALDVLDALDEQNDYEEKKVIRVSTIGKQNDDTQISLS